MRFDRYIIFELIKSTLFGSFMALVVLLGLQFLRLSELIIRFDLEKTMVLKMLWGLGTSFIPLIFPIAFLFSLLGLFGRLSGDREFIAMMAMGRSPKRILLPAFGLAMVLSITTAILAFSVGPRGNQLFEIFIDEAFRRKVTASLRSGTFSEGFLGMVVFVDQVDQTGTILDRVFVHDDKSFKESVSISAERGNWIQSVTEGLGILRLHSGVVISQIEEKQIVRRIEFDEYNIYADFSRQAGVARQSPPSLEGPELFQRRSDNQNHPEIDPRPIWVEIARRFAVAFVSLCFVPLAFGLAYDTSRTVKSRSVFQGITVLVAYWTMYFSLVTWLLKTSVEFVRFHEEFNWLVIWLPNLAVLGVGLFLAHRKLRTRVRKMRLLPS
jgi:LPS export ABC transporter permease LptF